jgi:hypothetical protein
VQSLPVGRARDILIGAFIALLPLTVAAVMSPPAAAASFRDSVLKSATVRELAQARATADWGGTIRATDGENVTIYFSDSYPVDQAMELKWADFMTTLVHGSELSTVTMYLAPLAEVQHYCGQQAVACYSPDARQIVAPADDVDAQTTAQGVLTHEYGHHVAESRLNPPFVTVDYGTKRWATYENVCAQAKSGALYPGAEDEAHYMLNPGEAFAESYRVLNEQKLGLAVEPWNIVSTSLYPDATALSLLEQDVTQPWTQTAATKLSVTLTKSVKAKSFVISTPYDGTLALTPKQSGTARVSVDVANSNGTSLATRTLASRTAAPISTTVCGQRSYTVRVKLSGTVTKKTKTTFTLNVSKP